MVNLILCFGTGRAQEDAVPRSPGLVRLLLAQGRRIRGLFFRPLVLRDNRAVPRKLEASYQQPQHALQQAHSDLLQHQQVSGVLFFSGNLNNRLLWGSEIWTSLDLNGQK